MTKKRLIVLLGLIAAVTITGCGNSEKETEPATSAPETAVEEAAALDETETETESETEKSLEPITPSDYLVENVSDYITLGDYEGLEVTQYLYDVTDDMVQARVQETLEMYGEETELDRAAAEGDLVYVDLSAAVQGSEEDPYTESTYFSLGAQEYGADFDQELTGASAGDVLNFSTTFTDEVWNEEWANQTVDFTVTVTSVSELTLPEYNDDFVKENTDYSTVSDYEEGIREELLDENSEESYYETIESLFQAAADQCEFNGYPQELYDSCKEELISLYSMFAGDVSEEEMYAMFGITEEDIDAEVQESVNRRLLVTALCEENNLEVTQEEYFSFVEENAEYYGYESAVQMEEDNTRESLVWSLYEAKAADLLYNSAKITETLYSEEDFSAEDIDELELEETEEDANDAGAEFSSSESESEVQ